MRGRIKIDVKNTLASCLRKLISIVSRAHQSAPNAMPTPRLLFVAGNRGNKFYPILRQTTWQVDYHQLLDQPSLFGRFWTFINIVWSMLRDPGASLLIIDTVGIYAVFLQFLSHALGKRFAVRLRGDFWLENSEILHRPDITHIRRTAIWLRMRAAEYIFRHSDCILPVSEYLQHEVQRQTAICTSRITPIPLFVALLETRGQGLLTRAEAKQALGIGNNRRIILTVTNFNYLNKVAALYSYAKVFDQLSASDPTIRWVIIGDGEYWRQEALQLIQTVHHKSCLMLLGKRSDLPLWYSACEFLLHFSRADAFPNVVLEAACYRRTTLANQFGGMQEQVINGKTGYLVHEFDQSAILSLSHTLLYDTSHREWLAENAFQHVSTKYNIGSVAQIAEAQLARFR